MEPRAYNTGYFNPPKHLFPLVRHFSCRLTPILLNWPITPNQITVISLLLGLAGAAFFSFGIWPIDVIGSLLLVVSYTLDNCDGEVARIKGLSSELGARLDDIVDSIVDTSFFVALGYGTAHVSGQQIWLWLGLAAALGAIIDYLVEQIKETRLKGKAEVKSREELAIDPKQPENILDWLIYIFHELSRADFCLIVLLLAVFNVTWVLLPLAAVGAQIFWITDLFDRARGYHT
ncbi:MAG: hypothetical protein HW411_469 [Gammaproteobacteria bacterium]|nr:hypothetical protein [Gammaproteobacteria bacterium]